MFSYETDQSIPTHQRHDCESLTRQHILKQLLIKSLIEHVNIVTNFIFSSVLSCSKYDPVILCIQTSNRQPSSVWRLLWDFCNQIPNKY